MYRFSIQILITILFLSSCRSNARIGAYSYSNGLSSQSIVLNENGTFKYKEEGCGGVRSRRGNGLYNLNARRLDLEFGEYDSLEIVILNILNVDGTKKLEINHSPEKLDGLLAYAVINNKTTDVISSIISKPNTVYIAREGDVALSFFLQCYECWSPQVWRYQIDEYENRECIKEFVYSDTLSTIFPGTKWSWRIGNNYIKTHLSKNKLVKKK